MAASYGQLGLLAERRGQPRQARNGQYGASPYSENSPTQWLAPGRPI
jgi:hypothetical protein